MSSGEPSRVHQWASRSHGPEGHHTENAMHDLYDLAQAADLHDLAEALEALHTAEGDE